MMGNPLNVDHLMFFGRVSNPNYQSDAASPLVDLNGGIFLDIQMWQGNSGGPVMDANTGCVLGSAELLIPINVGGVPIPTGIAYAIPIPNNL
jgi:S1-C subfamily serine protease